MALKSSQQRHELPNLQTPLDLSYPILSNRSNRWFKLDEVHFKVFRKGRRKVIHPATLPVDHLLMETILHLKTKRREESLQPRQKDCHPILLSECLNLKCK
jgi:virulence-associated protein VagC